MLPKTKQQHLLDQIQVTPLDSEHVEDIATLHQNILWWSFNGRMGKEHIKRLYQSVVDEENSFGFVCYVDGQLLGFVTATKDSFKTRKAVQKVYANHFLTTLWHMVKNPKAILAILESKFVVPPVFRKFDCNAEWLTFVTNTNNFFITPFVATKLMVALNEKFSQLGVKQYMAQGIKANPQALKFYEGLNWKVIQSLFLHNIYQFKPGETTHV